MSSPDKPVRANGAPRPGSRSSIVDEVVPGAIREPRVSMHDAATVPPPPAMPMAPPRNLRGSQTGVKLAPLHAPPVPSLRDYEEEKTSLGLGPVSVAPDIRDSQEISTDSLLKELASKANEATAAKAEAARLRLELDAGKVVAPPQPSPRNVRRSERHAAVLKVLGALAAVLGAVTTYLSIRANSVIEPKVDSANVRTTAVESAADTDHAAMVKLTKWARDYQSYRSCVDGQIRSAMRRGTGQLLISLPDTSVEWSSQNLPPTKAPVLWQSWTWVTISPCATEPAPP